MDLVLLKMNLKSWISPVNYAASIIPHDRVIWARSAQSPDQHIFHSSSIVISIALLVGCVDDDEVAHLAVKLLTHIAESTFFSAADQLLRLGQVSTNSEENEAEFSLLERGPILAEKAYRVIQQLCLHKYSCKPVSRYLRDTEQYFIVQASTPVVDTCQPHHFRAQYSDTTSSTRTGNRLASDLIRISLFAESNQVNLGPSRQPRSISPKDASIILVLGFRLEEQYDNRALLLSFFASLNFDRSGAIDGTGCQLFDLGAIISMLGATRQEIKRRGLLNIAAQQAEMQEEIKSMIESIVVENQRRQIASAQYHMLRSWSTLLRLTLSRAFHLVPAENRHIFLLDLLGSVLSKLVEGQVDSDSAKLLSGIVVALMIKLRHKGTQLGSLATGEAAQAFPFDRMIPILITIVQSIVLSNSSNIIRSTDGASTVASQLNHSRSTLEANTVAMISTASDRLLPVISKDAIMGSEVWRSVAFTALDSLLMLSDRSRSGSKLMAVLWRNGFMKNFVDLVKDAEGDLLAVLEPDPVMSIFYQPVSDQHSYLPPLFYLIRIFECVAGAEKLIDAKLLVRLGQCNYLSSSPQSLSPHQEFDMFIPSASERYHQLLLPPLQLVTCVLISLGSESGLATQEASSFINAQRETLMTCIRSAGMLTSSIGIQESLLITSILQIALPAVGDQEIASSICLNHHSSLVILDFIFLDTMLICLAAYPYSWTTSEWILHLAQTTACVLFDIAGMTMCLGSSSARTNINQLKHVICLS
ncbi:hypothetical protein Pst134EA_011340 [Puccinia striiformis f. sp. tritici]|uniref:hypothetical protein n=1 Tax=Puccinia striiformis f. sp. tritici TaxID=168172 RepID=UPI002008A31D|nr:hypothetical protein Pst134EA_011340 [Puccinia striiformis f. sp. tritici]KAH9467708.1 hypothetical protein Pst134EA_011340 [Puccinia striiformis f. sp. tritici]